MVGSPPALRILHFRIPPFFKKKVMDHPPHLHIKNTFIEVDQEDASDLLPRAFSDQSHARRQHGIPVPLEPSIACIPEEPSDTLSEKTESLQRLDTQELRSLRTISRPDVYPGIHYSFLPPRASPSVSPFPPFSMPVQNLAPAVKAVPIGACQWHEESRSMGSMDLGKKTFTKKEYDGRLSMVTEAKVHPGGVHRYVVYIEEGPVSVADGFGFVFSSTLPCKKNIQKIDSIFLNKKGKVCSRIANELEMLSTNSVGYIDVGSIVELVVDLEKLECTFAIYSPPRGIDAESLSILARDDKTISTWLIGTSSASIRSVVERLSGQVPTGHFCAVIKNIGTTVRFL